MNARSGVQRCVCQPGQSYCGSCGCPNNPEGRGLKRNGDPCSQLALPGRFRCYQHGGDKAVSVLKAREQLALLRLPAIETMYRAVQALDTVIEQWQQGTCLHCGYPSGDPEETDKVIKAAAATSKAVQVILDRTDIGPKSTVEVKQSDGDLDLSMLNGPERETMARIMAEFNHLRDAIRERLHGLANLPAGDPNADQLQTKPTVM